MSPSKTERRLALRRKMLLGGWLLAGAVVLARSAQLEVLEGAEWEAMAREQHRKTTVIPAPRGTIRDRNGVPLVYSRETVKVSVAPRELKDRAEARRLLREALDISASTAARVTDPKRNWAVVSGVYEPEVREVLSDVQGIYLDRELRRDHPHGDLAMGVLGRVLDGTGRGGIEEAFDSVLAGQPGREVVAKDSRGQAIPGQVFQMEPPVAGGDVTLTIDLALQEIAHQALAEAIEEHEARGGDLVVTDPRTGEILALVSMQDGRSDGLSAINTPYEPGSTLKPFTVAAILKNQRGSLGDSIDVGNGTWSIHGRVLHDVHHSGTMTLADALRVSSNVGVAKAAEPLTPREQYENLRDFGFGMQTGLPLPGEVGGTLRNPSDWSLQSPQSLAVGYEIGVTPLQMALAYGALANGGRLMEAHLVREVDPRGAPLRRIQPRVLRQVVEEDISRRIGRVLQEVVEDGTGTRAQLETFNVAGKSGTARAYAPNGGGYARGRYFASFVGYFPADDPQLVIFVKLDSPKGSYYGGSTAAPVTRATMEAALAARQTPLNRSALLRSVRRPQSQASAADAPPVRFASLDARWEAAAEPASGDDAPVEVASGQPVPVPDVRGLPPRVAVRRLHALGLRVVWDDPGPIIGTAPRAGSRLAAGDTIRLRTGRSER